MYTESAAAPALRQQAKHLSWFNRPIGTHRREQFDQQGWISSDNRSQTVRDRKGRRLRSDDVVDFPGHGSIPMETAISGGSLPAPYIQKWEKTGISYPQAAYRSQIRLCIRATSTELSPTRLLMMMGDTAGSTISR